MFKKLRLTGKFLRDYKISRIYLLLVLLAVNIFLFVSSFQYIWNIVASYMVTISIAIFLFTNSRKKLDAQQLDNGIMIKPFMGMPVIQLLNGPGSIVQRSPDVPEVPVSLVNWLYFCVLAITKSNEEKYHYHEHLITVVKRYCPDLLPWIPEMYKDLNEIPPVPENITMEDFNES